MINLECIIKGQRYSSVNQSSSSTSRSTGVITTGSDDGYYINNYDSDGFLLNWSVNGTTNNSGKPATSYSYSYQFPSNYKDVCFETF